MSPNVRIPGTRTQPGDPADPDGDVAGGDDTVIATPVDDGGE